jgi:biotin-dependent carboxylase-like uncharacterized protein
MHLAAAVPPSGALDRFSLSVANLLVGNPRGAAGLEWGLGGGALRFERSTAFVLTGADAVARLSGLAVEPGTPVQVRPGDVLEVQHLDRKAWLYVAVAGGIDVPVVLGSRSTYLPGAFGGLHGRILRSGDRLPVGPPPERAATSNAVALDEPDDPSIMVLTGPDRDALLRPGEWDRFLTAEYRVSRTSSRMGYRLESGPSRAAVDRDRPSVPVSLGTIQLPAGGEPMVLLADGPTVGGYARILVVASADVGRLGQRRPGHPVRFRLVELSEASEALRQQALVLDRLERGA